MTNPTGRASFSFAHTFCAVSTLLLGGQVWLIAQWSAAFSAATRQGEQVGQFLTHLPLGLGRLGATNLTWLSATVGTVGLVAAVVAARSLQGAGRALSIGLAAVNGVLVLWYVFSTM